MNDSAITATSRLSATSRFSACESTRSFDALSLIARSLEDVELFRAVLLKEHWEPAPAADGAALRIGFCRTPYWDQAEESTQRMLQDAAAKLAAAGAKVNEVELPPIFPRFANAARSVGGFEFVQQLAFELPPATLISSAKPCSRAA